MKRIGIGNHIGKWYTFDIVLIDEMFTFWLWTTKWKRPYFTHHNPNQYKYSMEQGWLIEGWFFGLTYN